MQKAVYRDAQIARTTEKYVVLTIPRLPQAYQFAGFDPPQCCNATFRVIATCFRKMGDMQKPILKRSLVIGGRKTSVSLEDEFWQALRHIARSRQLSLSTLMPTIKEKYQDHNLSSAIRLFVLDHFRSQ